LYSLFRRLSLSSFKVLFHKNKENDELVLTLFDKDGNVVTAQTDTDVDDLPKVQSGTDPFYAMRSAKMRKLRVTIDDGQFPDLAKAILQIKALESTDPSIVLTPAATHAGANMSLAVYHTITFGKGLPANTSRPQIVSIQRLRPGSQTAVAAFQEAEVTGPFDVRIVISELPHDFKIDHIEVKNGTKSGFVKGAPFLRRVGNLEVTDNVDRDKTVLPELPLQ
jgi:hypothetical protein